jgi:hypothetical protein
MIRLIPAIIIMLYYWLFQIKSYGKLLIYSTIRSDVFMETAAAVQLRQPVASTGEQIAHGQAGEVGFCVVVAREQAHQKQAATRGQRHAVVKGFWAVADD